MGALGTQQYRRLDLVAFDLTVLLRKRDGVAVERVRDFMAEGSGELLGVFHEIEQGIDDIDTAARRRKGIGLGFVHQEELEGMRVAGRLLV
jgi:hypothetical protein